MKNTEINLLLAAAATLLTSVTAEPILKLPTPVKLSVPTLKLTPIQSQLLCLKGNLAIKIFEKVGYANEA